MKKSTLVRNIIISAFVAELCLGAFLFSFLVDVKMNPSGSEMIFKNVIWGCQTVVADGQAHTIYELFNINSCGLAVVPALGLFMILFASIGCVLVAWLVKKPFAKWILLGLAAVILAGAIMQFFAYTAWLRATVNEIAKSQGVTDKAQIEEVYNEAKAMFDSYGAKAPMGVVVGVLGILGALGVAIPKMIPEKE